MVTIKDVSVKAGVSVSTVSKVIKDYPTITRETKNKVMDAIKELNYVPNMMASALSSKNYNRIAVWINFNELRQSIDEINVQYLHGAFQKGNELGLDLLPLFSTMFMKKDVAELSLYLKSQGVTGIVVYGMNKNSSVIMRLIEQEDFYCVIIDAPKTNDKTTSVMVDHCKGQYEVAKATVEGEWCKQILYLAGRQDGFITDMRIEGIKKLQEEIDVELKIIYADFSEKKARELTFEYGEEADIIVCASDLMAIGVKSALQEMDIFRPVCGYDGISLMGYAGEQMNTCKQDFFHISEVAIEEMERLLKGKKGRTKLLDFEIVRLDYVDVIL